jgi:hypothetical protein
MVAFGIVRYCRARDAAEARRVFARSINADRKEGDRPYPVSIGQIRKQTPFYIGMVAQKGYDEACKRMPVRFMDDDARESWANVGASENAKESKLESAKMELASLFAFE